jgi:hypothetical protein
VIFETAADEVDSVREQSGRQGVANPARQSFSIEGKGQGSSGMTAQTEALCH